MNLQCLFDSLEIQIAAIAALIALIALFAAVMVGVKQNQTFLLNYVSTRALQVNSFLINDNLPGETGAFSALVSNIVTTQESLKEMRRRFPVAHLLIWRLLRRVFYLQLHTTIRLWLQGQRGDANILAKFMHPETITQQIATARKFMKGPMKKY